MTIIDRIPVMGTITSNTYPKSPAVDASEVSYKNTTVAAKLDVINPIYTQYESDFDEWGDYEFGMDDSIEDLGYYIVRITGTVTDSANVNTASDFFAEFVYKYNGFATRAADKHKFEWVGIHECSPEFTNTGLLILRPIDNTGRLENVTIKVFSPAGDGFVI